MTKYQDTTTDNPSKPDAIKVPLPVRIYLGGSFDPVHISHIMMLSHVYHTIKNAISAEIAASIKASFLPTSRSPLKQQTTSPEHRLAMLKQVTALSDNTLSLADLTELKIAANFDICEHELWQQPPTYSIDTLQFLADNHPNHSIIFIVGADNIASLPKWRDGEKLTDYAHLWVVPRDEFQSPQAIKALLPDSLKTKVRGRIETLATQAHGTIFIDTHSVKAISSSEVRRAIAKNDTVFAKSALPHSVYSYIMKNNLYQSS